MAEEDDLALTQNDDEEQMSQTQSQTQSQSKKFYSLKFGARMEVIDVCPDTHGVLLVKMRWDVPLQSIVNQKVVIKYADVSTLLAKSIVCNQLEGLVFLELPNKAVSNQNRAFSTFLEDEIMDFYEAQSQDPSTQKKTFKEFTEITVEMIDDKYFLIAGEEDVFILNDGSTYSRKLNKQEIDDLDMNIVWNSKEKKEVFEASDKEAVNALVDVIATFNLLQVEKYYGFPLGSLVAHLRAYLYEPILKEQFTFYTTITLSGEQHGTGKSLMFAINQALLYGKQIPAEKHISDSKMFHRLAGLSEEGKVPVYVNEWDGNSNLFNSSVKGTWEASCWSVRGASFKPRTVLMANANATPDQIRFQAGVKSKVTFLYTGDARLKHDHKLEITRALVKRAKVAHVYLPSIIGLAIKTLMRPVSTEEVRGYDDELEDDEDERSAQALKDYDALFMELQDAITEYKLTVPPIFDKEPEHTVLTYFNESKGAEETPNEIDGRKKRAAKKLVKSLVETETLGAMSKRTYRDIEGYKVNCLLVPPSVQKEALSATYSISTTENGKRVRLRFLPKDRVDIEESTLIEDFLTSFSYLYKCGIAIHSALINVQKESFCLMIENSSNELDRLAGPSQVVTDEFAEDDVDNPGERWMCSVPGCKQKDTVWPSEDRLEQHRDTNRHKKAEAANQKVPSKSKK